MKLRIVETKEGKEPLETTPRYNVVDLDRNGDVVGKVWFNMTGYIGHVVLPDGTRAEFGECKKTRIANELALIERAYHWFK